MNVRHAPVSGPSTASSRGSELCHEPSFVRLVSIAVDINPFSALSAGRNLLSQE